MRCPACGEINTIQAWFTVKAALVDGGAVDMECITNTVECLAECVAEQSAEVECDFCGWVGQLADTLPGDSYT